MWPSSLLCLLFHSFVLGCSGLPVSSSSSPTVSTSLGPIQGASLDANVQRFTVPFAQPPVGPLRFAAPQAVQPWNSTLDGSKMPSSCMQYGGGSGGNAPSEDCLYLTVYRPAAATSTSKLPVLVWIHGGSFTFGSSTAAGLDGSKLASSGNVLVVFLQYRLGVFGFHQTESTLDESSTGGGAAAKVPGNQAVRDVVQSLSFLRDQVAWFGGDPTAITVAGQSSGAHMVRTLLTLPSAQQLFRRAILHSDPANYGPASARTNNALGSSVAQQLGCDDGEIACLRSKSAEDLLKASGTAAAQLPQEDGSIAQGEPWRPLLGSFFPNGLETGGSSKEVIITSVQNEAGSQVGAMLQPTPTGATAVRLDESYGEMSQADLPKPVVLGMMFNQGRGDTLSTELAYTAATTTSSVEDGLRSNIERISTDGLYRCAAWDNASRLSNAYVAVHHTGITYPCNDGNAYCAANGRVCHEDDIYAVFGTSSSASIRQSTYANEVRARWLAFVKSGNPNTQKFQGWGKASSAGGGKIKILQLGQRTGGQSSVESVDQGVCGSVWGRSVEFDWQLYRS